MGIVSSRVAKDGLYETGTIEEGPYEAQAGIFRHGQQCVLKLSGGNKLGVFNKE